MFYLKPKTSVNNPQNQQVVNPQNDDSQPIAQEGGSPGKPSQGPNAHNGLVVKYFSSLTEDQARQYGYEQLGGNGYEMPQESQQFMQERGSCLGVSAQNVNKWVQNAVDLPMSA